MGDLLLQHSDALEQEAEEKGSVQRWNKLLYWMIC